MAVSDKKRVAEAAPAGVLGLVGRFARQLPGADFAEEQLHNIESRALRELKQRLESVDDRRLPPPDDYEQSNKKPRHISRHPSAAMADLLSRAEEQTEEQAQLYIYNNILSELVPDEARLLSVLSDGTEHPLLHIAVGAPIGTPRRVVENISHLGKNAVLKLRDSAPEYITHLRNLALLEEGPADKEQDIKYQVLESEKTVRELAQAAEKGTVPGMGVRYVRRVIRISPLGRALWEACQPQQKND